MNKKGKKVPRAEAQKSARRQRIVPTDGTRFYSRYWKSSILYVFSIYRISISISTPRVDSIFSIERVYE